MYAALVVALVLALAPASALSATRIVAANGIDVAGCGTKDAPCRSISVAILNAVAGDTIEVGPGRYGDLDNDEQFTAGSGDEVAEVDQGCDCMIRIDRPVTIVSRDGAGATVLDAGGASVHVVRAVVPGVTFGKKGKGFTLTGSRDQTGFKCSLENVTIRGNRAVGNGGDGINADGNSGFIVVEDNVMESNGGDGLRLDDADVKIVQRNVAARNGAHGFSIGNGVSAVLNANLAVANQENGFELPARTTAKGNAAIGNVFTGFDVEDDSTVTGSTAHGNFRGLEIADRVVVSKSAVTGNAGTGIVVRGEASTITKTSIFGNGANADDGSPTGGPFSGPFLINCGVQAFARPLAASGNFWGAAGGPGSDPADAFCDSLGVVADPAVDPVATSEIKVKPKAAK